MSEAEAEDAFGGTCECKEIEILVGSEEKRHKNGNGSSVPRDDLDIVLPILARLPLSNYCDLRLVNRQFRTLIKSRDLKEIRKKMGIKEPKVFFFVLDYSSSCFCYEPYTRSCWDLPKCPTTEYFVQESFCVGTHLFICVKSNNIWGKSNVQNSTDSNIWRYELESKQWFNGPMMITLRYDFASADCGSVACVAGGTNPVSREVLNSAEKYNPESKSWEPLLSSMNRRRKYCTGFYMDSKFYVIGGRNENGDLLTCGECYDFERNVWELIPNMLENNLFLAYAAHKLKYFMVVVNNELYYFNFLSHRLKVYLKNNNTWKKVGKKVGSAPASLNKNSAVALKSLGNELLLIGRKSGKSVLCFCTPSPDLDDVKWHVLDFKPMSRSDKNCCVMMV